MGVGCGEPRAASRRGDDLADGAGTSFALEASGLEGGARQARSAAGEHVRPPALSSGVFFFFGRAFAAGAAHQPASDLGGRGWLARHSWFNGGRKAAFTSRFPYRRDPTETCSTGESWPEVATWRPFQLEPRAALDRFNTAPETKLRHRVLKGDRAHDSRASSVGAHGPRAGSAVAALHSHAPCEAAATGGPAEMGRGGRPRTLKGAPLGRQAARVEHRARELCRPWQNLKKNSTPCASPFISPANLTWLGYLRDGGRGRRFRAARPSSSFERANFPETATRSGWLSGRAAGCGPDLRGGAGFHRFRQQRPQKESNSPDKEIGQTRRRARGLLVRRSSSRTLPARDREGRLFQNLIHGPQLTEILQGAAGIAWSS